MPKPKYHVVVCTNARPPGHPKPSCGGQGSAQLLMAFNMGLMQRGIQPGDVLVTGSSCLGPCEQGPTVVVYPEGTWYSKPKQTSPRSWMNISSRGPRFRSSIRILSGADAAPYVLWASLPITNTSPMPRRKSAARSSPAAIPERLRQIPADN